MEFIYTIWNLQINLNLSIICTSVAAFTMKIKTHFIYYVFYYRHSFIRQLSLVILYINILFYRILTIYNEKIKSLRYCKNK